MISHIAAPFEHCVYSVSSEFLRRRCSSRDDSHQLTPVLCSTYFFVYCKHKKNVLQAIKNWRSGRPGDEASESIQANFSAQDISHHLSVKLMRPAFGRYASCTLGDFVRHLGLPFHTEMIHCLYNLLRIVSTKYEQYSDENTSCAVDEST